MNKVVWKLLFGVTGVICLWFGVKLGRELYPYLTLSKRLKAESIVWSIENVSKDKYGVRGTYRYSLNGTVYASDHLFRKPTFVNAKTAEKHINAWNNHVWDVWVNARHPTKSTLQHIFPYSSFVQFILTVGIFLYFQWLRQYVARHA